MEGTTATTGFRKTIYIATEDLWNEIQDAADRKDWSVSRYLMNCHRAYSDGGRKEASPDKFKAHSQPSPESIVETVPKIPFKKAIKKAPKATLPEPIGEIDTGSTGFFNPQPKLKDKKGK